MFTLSTPGKIFSRRHIEIFYLFFPENSIRHFMILIGPSSVVDVPGFYFPAEIAGRNSRDLPGLMVIKLFSCSTQLCMKLPLLVNMKMPTIVGIFIFISRETFMLRYV